jgi:hypothetical protein
VFLDRLLQTLNLTEIGGSTTLKQHELDGHYAQGSLSDTLLESWADCWDTHSPQRCSSRSIAFPTNSDRCDDSNADTIDKLIGVLSEANFRDLSAADILRTAVVWLIQMVVDSVSPVQARVDEVWFSTDTPLTYCLVNQFIQRSGLDVSHVHSAGSIGTLGPKQQIGAGNPQAKRSSTGQRTDDATTTAILGFLHIDQMPASVPSLTTATDQRILGRITPGKPSNWRQLLREMADFHPPAMKLRDAV